VTATFTRCRFIANTATTPSTSDGGGAASHVLNTTPTYRDCVFFGNTASAGVGGALLSSSSGSAPTLINCVLAGNSAKFSGGGIYMTSTSSGSIVRNCTIVGNTVFGNFGTSPGTGGGISGGGLVTNTIIWGNTAPSNSQVNGASNISYSDVQGGIAGIGNINADPLFRRLPSIGADNAWGTIDDDYGDLRVQSGASPVVDAGSNAAVPAAVTLDLGQKNRTTNIPGVRDPGNIVDMGAYELGVPVTILGGSTANQWYLRLTVDRTTLQVWFGSDTSGTPTNYVLASNGTITFDLAGGNDTLYLDLSRGPIGDVTFLGGSGIDKVAVLHTSPYERDLNVQATHLTSDGVGVVTLDSVETKALDGPPGTGVALRSLAVVDTVTLTSGKDLVLLVPSIEVTPTGRLDLTDGALLVDYAAGTPSPIGGWNAAQQKYTGLTGLLDSGRGDGSWDGGGIVTSLSIVGDSTTRTLGVNETSAVFGVSYGESLIWKGAVIDSTMVIIRYTYLGDIDLNGEINGDDYFFLDSNVMNSGVVFGYGVGDINLDGEINGDDYFWLDSQILAQGPPL
jgi:parallel beta-helix repeat protein